MTASKDSHASRPSIHHRSSMCSATTNASSRHARPHAHSLSAGSINPAHRVTRRKSMSSTAVVNGAFMKSGLSPKVPGFGANSPNNGSAVDDAGSAKASIAVTDGPPLDVIAQEIRAHSKSRARRASEGSRLSKGESKRQSGSELRCDKCGKGYKHSSCLTKHLWEHTPEWAYTSKLLISKHQQVQLLEAASVLVTMNQEPSSSDIPSDHSSASPAASGSSDPREEYLSSTDTTPPPHADDARARRHFSQATRKSSMSSTYSRSYQSASAASVFSESAPAPQYFSHYRQWSADQRPSTSATSIAGSNYEDEDQADLAAAVGLLSCSYGTPKSGPSMLPPDVPPVPPLPARFLGSQTDGSLGSTMTPKASHVFVHAQSYSGKEMDMDNRSEDDDIDMSRRPYSRTRDDEYDDDVFAMEE